jgi:hypothetical protein
VTIELIELGSLVPGLTPEVVVVEPEVVGEPQQPVSEVQVIELRFPGPPGPPGESGVAFEYQQTTESSSWLINHNLGFLPVLSVFNQAGHPIEGEVLNLNTNQTQVNFKIPIRGSARLLR